MDKENAIYIEEMTNKEDGATWLKITIVKEGNDFFTKYTKTLRGGLLYSLRKRYGIKRQEVFIGRGKAKELFYKVED